MSNLSRKKFLYSSAVLATSLAIGSSFDFKRKPLLSFSTLGCPDWTFDKIIEFAKQHGYSGIELRGIKRQMDLTQCPEFSTEAARQTSLRLMKQKGLKFVNLGSSATLHFAEGAEREKNIAEGKRFIDLAAQIECPYIRVFPNNFPQNSDKANTIRLIQKGLLELADHAKEKQVTVLMETHGDLVWIDDLVTVMQPLEHPNLGLVWDPVNMWTITKESPREAYRRLKKHIRHAHIKDALLADGKSRYTLLGKGETPIFEAIDALANDRYTGYYSFEWEKLWHPEISEPELALADYPVAIKKHFQR